MFLLLPKKVAPENMSAKKSKAARFVFRRLVPAVMAIVIIAGGIFLRFKEIRQW